MKTVAISFKVDENIKKEFDRIAYDIGVSTSSLLNILIKRTVRENGIPFDVTASPREFVDKFDEETQREIIKELVIEQGLIPDDSIDIDDVDSYMEGKKHSN
ncbi:type II toxin-antitoxin system RelB/DinJ family antitoxin [Lactobacillus salivarius]|uniref:Type II toxin-antitoxin system RelB/DinJ family antitoxin n=1 Tax=Ligilactobacillus salivarius TaxID=1624 RepID=A0A6A8LKN5_9LACO|nr:type II toxin-antitoxin system RelB/DinJ family antitoxin [Ligilactobacillus salivarius]MSE07492.1 type II toxin-antitoxin system RelB/DinJ family antitoxin [Ligilactobacillus salivarius]